VERAQFKKYPPNDGFHPGFAHCEVSAIAGRRLCLLAYHAAELSGEDDLLTPL